MTPTTATERMLQTSSVTNNLAGMPTRRNRSNRRPRLSVLPV
ncbi:hypothetical protein I551_6015 [Mycobacterium ulcerans str. Harvey]|uniref:Uncharacterized protein n=1 Tax=Mycobacterium ulcerans str. Harvey TaxID=1299332 RepID=A0ABN0QS85_MYCUL|nr:hypothetical protein I551_6015 [Mycobacterium ulcerans str. Harvey]